MKKYEEIFAFIILIIFRIAGCFLVWYIEPGNYLLLGGVIILLVLTTLYDWHTNKIEKEKDIKRGWA